MRSTLIAALVGAALPMMALAQTEDELKNDEKAPGDVLTYGMGYSQNRFSPLTPSYRLAGRIFRLEPVRDHPPRGTDHVGEGRFLTEGALGILITRFAPRGLGCPGGIVSLSFSRCFICNGRDFAGR